MIDKQNGIVYNIQCEKEMLCLLSGPVAKWLRQWTATP